MMTVSSRQSIDIERGVQTNLKYMGFSQYETPLEASPFEVPLSSVTEPVCQSKGGRSESFFLEESLSRVFSKILVSNFRVSTSISPIFTTGGRLFFASGA